MSVWFKSRLNPWYIWIPSNPNLYSTKIIMKMRWQTVASNVSIRTISPTATPLPKAYDCVAVYIAGRRTSLVVYGWWPQPPTKNFGYTSNSGKTPIPRPHGRGMGVFRELFQLEKNDRDIGSALYSISWGDGVPSDSSSLWLNKNNPFHPDFIMHLPIQIWLRMYASWKWLIIDSCPAWH